MWRVIRTEMAYFKVLFLIFLGGTMACNVIEMNLPESPSMMFIVIFLFLQGQYWIIFRNKWKRDVVWASLPIAGWKLALARILVLILIGMGLVGGYLGLKMILTEQQIIITGVNPLKLLGLFSLYLCVFILYFICRDCFLFFLRTNRYFKMNEEKSRTLFKGFLFLVLLFNFYLFYAGPSATGDVIKFIINNDPFGSPIRVGSWIIAGIILMLLSIRSYTTRKSYLE